MLYYIWDTCSSNNMYMNVIVQDNALKNINKCDESLDRPIVWWALFGEKIIERSHTNSTSLDFERMGKKSMHSLVFCNGVISSIFKLFFDTHIIKFANHLMLKQMEKRELS